MSEFLGKINNQAAELYAEKTGEELEEVRNSLREEKWFTANEAVEAGLADEVVELEAQEDEDEDNTTTEAEMFERRNAFFRISAFSAFNGGM